MAHEMTAQWLKAHCKDNGGYGTPSLNDKLYLHFQGFDRIANLEPYTGLKSLFLEGNGLENLEGLETCTELRCLFAQQNMITSIPESLPVSLSTLNVSSNNVSSLRNLARLAELQTLQASNCKLKTLESIDELRRCASLSTIDLEHNEIDGDPERLVDLFKSAPSVACLYLRGNPIVSRLRQYRKRMIAALPGLAYLDDRPVFPLERACAEAWLAGGLDAEKEARKRFKDEECAKQRRDHEYLTNLRESARAKREALADRGSRAIADLGVSDSDGEYEPEEEPPELIAARARLAQYEARPGEEEPPELTEARLRLRSDDSRATEKREDVDADAAGGAARTKPWQPLGGPAGSLPAENVVEVCLPDAAVSLAPPEILPGAAGLGAGGAAGRAEGNDENVEPVSAASAGEASVSSREKKIESIFPDEVE
jgi:dynein assembly factor 1